MKKILSLLLVLILSLGILVGCGDKDAKEPEEGNVTEGVGKEESEEKVSEDGKLTKVGQVIKDKDMGATVELLKIIETNETLDLDPIKLTLEDIKIINMSDIKKSEFKDYLSQFTDEEEFDYIQINYSMENTVDENIELYSPIEYIALDSGEQIDVMMEDVRLDHDNGGEFFGKVTKESGIFVIIESSRVEDINSIKLITGDVWEADGDIITDKIEKEYSFE